MGATRTKVFVVTWHNPTSGKGSYHLAGVFWTQAKAEAYIATARTRTGPAKFDIRQFEEVAVVEHENDSTEEGGGEG